MREGPVGGSRSRAFSCCLLSFALAFVVGIAGLILGDALYVDRASLGQVFASREIRAAIWLSLWTSGLTTVLGLVFAVPMGYALSRYSFRGKLLVDTLVDLPIVFPPLVLGLSLLIFFRTPLGVWIESLGLSFVYHPAGIVLAQFLTSASFGIRTIRSTFDEVDRRQEEVALTLGCSEAQAFRMVAAPNARRGIVAGGILIWARAFGVFGPLLVFVGSVRMRTEVMPTTVYLETSVGHLEVGLAVALVMIAMAAAALVAIRTLGGRSL